MLALPNKPPGPLGGLGHVMTAAAVMVALPPCRCGTAPHLAAVAGPPCAHQTLRGAQ